MEYNKKLLVLQPERTIDALNDNVHVPYNSIINSRAALPNQTKTCLTRGARISLSRWLSSKRWGSVHKRRRRRYQNLFSTSTPENFNFLQRMTNPFFRSCIIVQYTYRTAYYTTDSAGGFSEYQRGKRIDEHSYVSAAIGRQTFGFMISSQ